MSGRPGPLRVLLHKPLRREREPYFRVQQYVAALRQGGRLTVVARTPGLC